MGLKSRQVFFVCLFVLFAALITGPKYKEAVVTAGAALGTAALIGWGISNLLSSSSTSTSASSTSAYGSSSSSRTTTSRNYEQPQPPTISWQNQEIYIMNCDGSDQQHSGSGGYGAVIKDRRGEVIAAVAGKSERVNITVHELQGVEAGLKLAKTYGIRRIEARTDNEAVYCLLKRRNHPRGFIVDIFDRIEEMVEQLEYFEITKISEKDNVAADYLSKLRPDTEYLEMSPSEFPQRLKEIIDKEKNGLSRPLDYNLLT